MPATVTGSQEVKLDAGADDLRRRPAASRPASAATRWCARRSCGSRPARTATGRDGRPRVEGVVDSSLYLGTATQIAVDLGEGVRMTVLVPNADEAERQRLPGGGARVALSWEPEHMHLVRESPTATPRSNDGASAADQSQLETTHGG